MAKATHSQEILTGTSDSFNREELLDPHPPVVVRRAMLGGEPKSVGMNYSESSNPEMQSAKSGNQGPPSPAQTMVSLSNQTEAELVSSVHSMDGVGPKTIRKQSGNTSSVRKKINSRPISNEDEFD